MSICPCDGGCGDADGEVDEFLGIFVITDVAWRFAGLAVERVTYSRRVLYLVRFMSRAAFASSCYLLD